MQGPLTFKSLKKTVGEGGWGDLKCCYSAANALICSPFTGENVSEMGASHVQAVQVKKEKKKSKNLRKVCCFHSYLMKFPPPISLL